MSLSALQFDVIVIGGGVAGISTVYHLLKGGYEAKIGMLEGRARLGGRLHSLKSTINRACIELGANWIHGTEDNPIYEILKPYCKLNRANICSRHFTVLSLAADEDEVQVLETEQTVKNASTGEILNRKLVAKVCQYYKFLETDLGFEESVEYENEANNSSIHYSIGEFYSKKFTEWLEENLSTVEEIETARLLIKTLYNYSCVICGCESLNELSFKYFGAYKDLVGNDAIMPRGYFVLIEILLQKIAKMTKKFQYFLESTVVRIKWPGEVDSISEDYPVKIICSNGITYHCRSVVVTIPLGCLQKTAKDLFEPRLPQYKLNSIGKIGYGTVDKIFLEYSTTNHLNEMFGKQRDYFLIWQPEEEPRWCQRICGLSWYSKHVIMFWIVGTDAATMEQLPLDELNQVLTGKLRKIFQNPKIPEADFVLPSKWASDPYSLGSYSFIKVGQTPDDIVNYAKPVYNQNRKSTPLITFAGEATSPAFFSTVHGAFYSGLTVAGQFGVKLSEENQQLRHVSNRILKYQ